MKINQRIIYYTSIHYYYHFVYNIIMYTSLLLKLNILTFSREIFVETIVYCSKILFFSPLTLRYPIILGANFFLTNGSLLSRFSNDRNENNNQKADIIRLGNRAHNTRAFIEMFIKIIKTRLVFAARTGIPISKRSRADKNNDQISGDHRSQKYLNFTRRGKQRKVTVDLRC